MCFTWCEKTPAFATSVGMATIAEFTVGFPGCKGRIPFEAALLSEVLAEQGWNTYCVGKWRSPISHRPGRFRGSGHQGTSPMLSRAMTTWRDVFWL